MKIKVPSVESNMWLITNTALAFAVARNRAQGTKLEWPAISVFSAWLFAPALKQNISLLDSTAAAIG